jgi:hypothetical protein
LQLIIRAWRGSVLQTTLPQHLQCIF